MSSDRILPDGELEPLCRSAPILLPGSQSYGVVRDYVESLSTMPGLARYQGDLKDVQRPWMLKVILSLIPRGKKVIEIGSGEPIVAHILHRAGYDVTVVDPYDGSGGAGCA